MSEIRTVKRESDVVYKLFAIILSDIFRIAYFPAASTPYPLSPLNSFPLSTGLIVYKEMFQNYLYNSWNPYSSVLFKTIDKQ